MKNKSDLIFILIFFFVIFINIILAQSFGNIFGFYKFNNNTLFLNHLGLPSEFNIQNNKIISLNSNDNKSFLGFEDVTYKIKSFTEVLFENKSLNKPAATCSSCNDRNYEKGDRESFCECDEWEKCKDFFIKSTVYNYDQGDTATDYCSGNSVREMYIDCAWGDETFYTEKNCNDYDNIGDWEYYCTNGEVRRKKYVKDYDCRDGACNLLSESWEGNQLVSKNGDGDYCTLRKKYGCSLCVHEEYDCEYDTECSGDLKCKGPIGGASDGCCYANEEWDTIKKECVEIECYKNSDCGTDGYSNICKDDDEYKRYISYTCNNPKQISSYCTSSKSDTKIKECGTSGYTGNKYCYAGDVYQDYAEKGCSSLSCYSNTNKEKIEDCNYGCETGKCKSKPAECSTGQTKCEGYEYYDCENGWWDYEGNVIGKCGVECLSGDKCIETTYYLCQNYKWKSQGNVEGKCGYKECTSHFSEKCYDNDIYWYDKCGNKEDKKLECGDAGCSNNKCNVGNTKCSKNSDCGTDGWTGDKEFCRDGDVWHRWKTWTCNNAGTTNSWCQNNDADKFKKGCEYGCENAKCKPKTENTTIPDLTITDLVVQNVVSSLKNVVIGFTIKNIGNGAAEKVYWKIEDKNTTTTKLSRIQSVTLKSGEYTRAYMLLHYSKSGIYNPKVIVDYNNYVKESNENNNEKIISVII